MDKLKEEEIDTVDQGIWKGLWLFVFVFKEATLPWHAEFLPFNV